MVIDCNEVKTSKEEDLIDTGSINGVRVWLEKEDVKVFIKEMMLKYSIKVLNETRSEIKKDQMDYLSGKYSEYSLQDPLNVVNRIIDSEKQKLEKLSEDPKMTLL